MLTDWTSREKKLLLTSCILALLLLSMLISSWLSKGATNEPEFVMESFQGKIMAEQVNGLRVADERIEIEESDKEKPVERVMVDIKGAVHKPYVYEMKADERVIDVILEAGGLLETASTDPINLAQKVFDGMVIYIPTKEEVASGEKVEQQVNWLAQPSSGHDQGATTSSEKININTATQTELETLPGIGPSRAKAIISYREEHGPFVRPEELMNVSGIGSKIFANLKDEIVVR